MESNPYAPPKAPVADRSSGSTTGLKRRRVLVMIVFTVVTFGLQYVINRHLADRAERAV